MKLSSPLHLGRSIDIFYPYHQAILLISLVVGVAWNWPSLGWGTLEKATVPFMAWAITRELDPDHPISALLAAVLTSVVIWYASGVATDPNFWLLGFVLLAVRAMTGITGQLPTWFDWFVLASLAVMAGWQLEPLELVLTQDIWIILSIAIGFIFWFGTLTQISTKTDVASQKIYRGQFKASLAAVTITTVVMSLTPQLISTSLFIASCMAAVVLWRLIAIKSKY